MRTRSGADHKLPSDVEDPTSSFPPSMREEKEMADDANDGGKNEMESFENEDEPNDSLSEHESSVGGQEQIDDYDYSGSITDLEKYGLDLQKFNGVKTKTKRHTGEIQINFDKAGNLWLSYVDGESGHIARRAVFHHWIREDLAAMENAKSVFGYDFPAERKCGIGATNKTCFSRMQQRWGATREYYCRNMFEYERPVRTKPRSTIRNLYYHGLLVIDYWGAPIRDFRQFPLVLSDRYEGAFIEPTMRICLDMRYRDFRARMPPFIRANGNLKLKEIWNDNALGNRTERFRKKAGAISWKSQGVNPLIKTYMDSCPSQAARVGNSTKACTDLTQAELDGMSAATQRPRT